MQVNRRYVWAAAALAAVLLIFLWWNGGGAITVEVERKSKATAESKPRSEIHSRARPIREEKCAACPDLPVPQGEKRTGITPEELEQLRRETLASFADRKGGCTGLLLRALLDGNPNPDTSGLGGCEGRTPLHLPHMTPDLAREMIEAGADVNAPDAYGRTPLHVQSVRPEPTPENLEIVKLFLEAGADATSENEHGEAPWKTARLNGSTWIAHLNSYQRMVEEAEALGVSTEAYLDAHPRRRERMMAFLDSYLVEGQIKKVLLDAAVSTKDPTNLDSVAVR